MKDLDLTQVFCEVLTGLGVLIVALSLVVLMGSYTLLDVVLYATGKLSLASLGAILVAAFLIGTMMDAVGFAFDKLIFDRLIASGEPSEEHRARFWKTVSAHVLAYREAQWTYYSCYRNLFILFVPGSIIWTIVVWTRVGME